MVTGENVGVMKYKFQIYKIHLVFGHLSALFENITIKCAAMESRLKHAGWNKRADWNFPQKTINVQDLIRACRVIKKFEINKRACTFIRYSRVGAIQEGLEDLKEHCHSPKRLTPEQRDIRAFK